jgi:hypothetical protein
MEISLEDVNPRMNEGSEGQSQDSDDNRMKLNSCEVQMEIEVNDDNTNSLSDVTQGTFQFKLSEPSGFKIDQSIDQGSVYLKKESKDIKSRFRR